MNYKEIGEALKAAGFSWDGAAKAMDSSVSNLRNVASGRLSSKRVALSLCALIDCDPADVFPEHPRYLINKEEQINEEAARGRVKLIAAGLIES